MSKPTISDVADRAGVSKATVSAVINNKGTTKNSTRRKVLDAIDDLNYRPSASAQRRFQSSTGRSIGLVVKEADNPYYAEVIAGIRPLAQENDYTLVVASSEGSYDAEKQIVELFTSKDIDGLIITPVLDRQTDLSHIFELKRRNIPFVLLEEVRGVQANLVDVDSIMAFRNAVKYLIDHGHERIVHFAGPDYSAHSEERIEGVRRAFSESELVFSEDIVIPAGAHLEDGYEAGLKYFKNREAFDRPTAVTCYNDLVAIGLFRALMDLDIGVPNDVSIIGCDDLELLKYLPIRLSSIHSPKFDMGQKAADMLIQQVEASKVLPLEKSYLEAELVIRDSVRSLKDAPKETA